MEDPLRAGHRRRHSLQVADVALGEGEPPVPGEMLEVPATAGGEVVHTRDGVPLFQQKLAQIAADEAGSPGNNAASGFRQWSVPCFQPHAR